MVMPMVTTPYDYDDVDEQETIEQYLGEVEDGIAAYAGTDVDLSLEEPSPDGYKICLSADEGDAVIDIDRDGASATYDVDPGRGIDDRLIDAVEYITVQEELYDMVPERPSRSSVPREGARLSPFLDPAD